jgi:ABC-type transport system involved in multi-copper enzyme maturation permease subunit
MGNVGAVFLFEWKRSLTLPRMAWWAVLALFPVFIIGLIRFIARIEQPEDEPPRELWIGFLFALVPMLVSMLGTLLWTTPAISAELERRSWVYLTVRPHGGTAVLLGKYLAAVTWVIPPALVGLTIAIYLSGTDDAWRIWWTMVRLVCLSCPAYAAIYLVLGTLMPRRAMVLAVAYTLIFELVISFVPAVINKLTVQYRLRALLVEWCDVEIVGGRSQSGVMALIGDEPAWQHVLILMLLTPTLLALAVAILRWSEFSSSAESDV